MKLTVAAIAIAATLWNCGQSHREHSEPAIDSNSKDSPSNDVDTAAFGGDDSLGSGYAQERPESQVLSDFVKSPLKYTSYKSILSYLKDNKIKVKETVAQDRVSLSFGRSSINLNVNNPKDAMDDVVCAATVQESPFPLAKPFFFGMTVSEFATASQLSRSLVTRDSIPSEIRFRFIEDRKPQGLWEAEFIFRDDKLFALQYEASPCTLADQP